MKLKETAFGVIRRFHENITKKDYNCGSETPRYTLTIKIILIRKV